MNTMEKSIALMGICVASAITLSGCGTGSDNTPRTEVKPASQKTESAPTAAIPAETKQETAAVAKAESVQESPDAKTIKNLSLRPEKVDANSMTIAQLAKTTTDSITEVENTLETETTKSSLLPGDGSLYLIKAEPEVLDFGDIPTRDKKKENVKLTNISDEPVTISRITASCGCTAVNFVPNTVLAGGESVDVEVQLSGGTRSGPISGKQITVIAEGHPNLPIPLKANAISFVVIEPAELDPDAMPEGKFKLRSIDGTPFRVISMSPPVIDELPEESAAEHDMVIDWDRFRELGAAYTVTFHVDHPKCLQLMVRVKFKPEEIRAAIERKQQDRRERADANVDDEGRVAERASRAVPSTQLVSLIKSGQNDAVMKRIEEEMDVNERDSTGATPLSLAAKYGNSELINLLTDAGADIDSTDQVGRTPLMWAAQSKNVAAVQALLDAGASVSVRDNIGGTALTWACGVGDSASVKELIDAGSDVNVVGAVTGWTPLIWAAGFGDPNAIKPLVDAGADVEAADLLQGAPALLHAARTGKVESVKSLIESGADLESADRNGHTPLLAAAANAGGDAPKIRALIEAGANIHAKDNSGRNALDLARIRTDARAFEVIELLEPLLANADKESKE